MSETTQNIQPQILITCRTAQMVREEFPVYSKTDLAQQEMHISLGIMPSNLQPNGFQLYIGNNVTYTDYLAMLKHLTENPLSEKVFEKMQNRINSNNTQI